MNINDYTDSRCCFDTSDCRKTPDGTVSKNCIDVPEAVKHLDALLENGREGEAEAYLESRRSEAAEYGDWRGELSMLSELLGQYRRSGKKDKGLDAAASALKIIREHGMEGTVSGATVMLNAATTLKCFGKAEESLPLFKSACRVYSEKLDPADYRFGGLYNNMALSYADTGDYKRAEQYFILAMRVISRCENPENELAVTLCNMAEMYDSLDSGDERIALCMEKAWEYLNSPGLKRDAYHAFTISKCISSFDYFGYFIYAGQLRERAKKIYERN